jgi:hypothetical protein
MWIHCSDDELAAMLLPNACFVMSSDNVTLHPIYSGDAAILKACSERAKRVEWETSLNISESNNGRTTVGDSSASVGMTERDERLVLQNS